MNLHYFYEIDGLTIAKAELDDPKYRYITYKTWLCVITIATDDMGTNICFNGCFFGGFFPTLEMAVIYLRANKEKAIKFFRQVYIEYLKYKLSRRHFRYLIWRFKNVTSKVRS
jgi:hypothetical protein